MTHKIKIKQHEIYYRLRNIKVLKRGLLDILYDEKMQVDEITFILCTDKYLLALNKNFLGHDTFTDILTFGLSQPGWPVQAEIYISLERVKENAELYKVYIKQELYRVMIHGVLHLCGYDDHSKEQIEKMREKESFYLSRL